MLRTKEDVVRHADDILRKARTETEKKSRCFFIAQLFSKIKEFEQVKHYVQQYLSIKPDSSPAYKLLGQAYECLGQVDKAVVAYENSLKYDPTQAELLLKICELYSDNNVHFDPVKIKSALVKTEKCFPYHSAVFNLKEKLMKNGTDTDRDEYEKLLNVELKSKPNDSSVRIKILMMYLETDRVELAYVTSCELENKGLFKRRLEWYECFDSVCDAYKKMYHTKCGSIFYSYWLHALDLVCSLTYSVEFKKSLNDCFKPICKFDRILNEASKIKEAGSGFGDIIDHFSGQLSLHLSNLISKKAKEDSDYSSDLLKIQIWSERKTKIGSLLLFSIKNGVPKANPLSSMMKENQFKLHEARIHQSKTRFIEAYYTLNSLAKNHNQGEKQFIDSVNFYTSGLWRNDIYKIFSQLSDTTQADSYFMHSNYFTDIPQKFPSLNEINSSFYESFEITYNGSLHHMIWLGLRTISNLSDPFATKIDPNLRTTIFKGLSLTTNMSSYGIESLNQLDVDSFLYLTLLCKALSIKQSGPDQPVTMPSSITSYLVNEKEERWWNKICVILRNVNKDEKCNDMNKYSNSDNSDAFQTTRLEVQRVIEQIRGNNLQLQLIIHLARTFTNRSSVEHADVQDACEKRALYLWNLVVINLKDINNKLNFPSINQKSLFFNYDVSNLTHSEVNLFNTEACLFTGSYFIKCRLFNRALEILKLAQTPESLYKQALIYETLSVQDIEALRADEITSELRAKRATFAGKARDCLGQAVDMIKSSGDRNHPLMNEINVKLITIDRLLCHIKSDNIDDENNGLAYNSEGSASAGSCDMEEECICQPAAVSSGRIPKTVLTSTPRRWKQEMRSNALTTNAVDLIELLTLHQNTNQLKLQRVVETTKLASDRLETIISDQKTIKNMIEDLSNRLGKLETDIMTNFNDLKKEVKQKPDLYNMLDDDEYNAEEVLNFQNMSNYFPRGGNVPNIANTAVAYPPAPAIPASSYFPPNSLYQGNVLCYGQSPFGETQQMADYLRTFAMTNQRGNSLTNLQAGLPLQPTIMGAPNLNLPHLQVPSVSSPPAKNTSSSQQAPNNVVITTSDALPTNVPTTAPTLFVNIPPEHRLGTVPVSATTSHPIAAVVAPHQFQIPMPSNFKLVEKSPVADPAEDKNIEATLDVSKESDSGATITELDPLPNFKPIIPLPDEVEVKTGEENETVIFDCRAKLFRFVDKEWKERGLGQLKILKSKDDRPHFRIIMRREQVHKICANHFITEDMKLIKASNNDKSYIWWAHDFADEKVEVEKFLVRFKTAEDGEQFKHVFEEAKQTVEGMSSSTSTPKNEGKFSQSAQSSKTILTPPKLSLTGSNQENKSAHFAAVADTNNKITIGGFTFSSEPKLTDVSKEKDSEKSSAEKNKPTGLFTSFNFGNSKSDDKSQSSQFSFSTKSTDSGKSEMPKEKEKCESSSHFSSKLMEFLRPEAGSWECDACYTRNKAESRSCVSCETPHQSAKTSDKPPQSIKPAAVIDTGKKTEKSSNLPSLSSLFKPPQGSWSCEVCLVQNKAETTSCVACGTVKPGCTVAQKSAPVQSFSFGIPPSNTSVTATSSFPPIAKANDSNNSSTVSSVDSSKNLPVFGSAEASSSIFSFGGPSSVTSPTSNFSFGSAKFSFTIKTPTKGSEEKSPHTTPKSALKSDADESDNEHDEEDKDHTEGIYFQPVVDLPDKIDVKTGEEDELVLYSQRSKLFRYIAEGKEWKERGLGDVKILKHKTSGKIRLLMRREPVMKLCLNHYVTSDIEMKAKDPKSWIWCAADFSEGEQAIEKFCIRFKTPDIAQEFKQKFDRIKNYPDEFSPAVEESDDVVFVSETTVVSEELKAKALALQLPANFYKYLDSPGCKGCRGCENDSDDQNNKVTSVTDVQIKAPWFAQNSATSGIAQNSPMFFGSKSLNTPPVDNSSSFGTSSNAVQVAPPATGGGIGAGNSLFGGGAVKPSVFTMVQVGPDPQITQKDKAVTFTPPTPNVSKSQDIPKTQSQMSTFSFASALTANATGSPVTPVFSFPPQNSVFGASSGGFFEGQTAPFTSPVFGGQNTNSPVLNAPLDSTNTSSLNPTFWSVSSFESPVTDPSFWSTSSQSPIFGTATSFAKTDLSQSATPIFGSTSTTLSVPESQKINTEPNAGQESKGELAFLNKGSLSFSSIVAQASTTNTFVGDNSSFKWEGAGATIFGSKKTESPNESVNRTKDNEDETAEKEENQDEHDPYFEPIVPLPDKIELKTGEEDEDIIFSERAKLYRRDPTTKEWKERGIGLMKLLEHRENKTYRLLMRREQVHKIVCNHRITPDLKLNPIKNSENSYCWAAMNLTQDCTEPSSEVLSIKFKNRDLAVRFKNAFEEAQHCAEQVSPTKN